MGVLGRINAVVTLLTPSHDLVRLPNQPAGVPWPTTEWPTGTLPDGIDAARLEGLLDRAFGSTPDPGFHESHAVVLIHRGRLVAERYGPGVDATTPLLSWSMAKSIIHALVGILVEEGLLDPHDPVRLDGWTDPADPRSLITLDHLLRMVDGLDFNESYVLDDEPGGAGFSHCIDMLFGLGKDHPGAYAAQRPAAHPPDTIFNYSSGTTNIVAMIVGDLIGRGPDATRWMHNHLFGPLGMTSATPTYDADGYFIGSSYFHATARDWAKFGLLYLRGGEWDGHQVIPRSWVDSGRTTRASDDDKFYGAHWWTSNDGSGRFQASGYEWQRVICVPKSDLVAVRLGKTPSADYDVPRAWLDEIISLFDNNTHR